MREAGRLGALVVVALLGMLALGTRSAAAQERPEPSGQELLARAAAVYAHCTSYQDTGVVMILFMESGGDRTEERPFKTAFVRPDRFRFEYEETGAVGAKRRYIIWRVGSDVRTWWDVQPGVEGATSLDEALSAATGVSGGSAHAIPALLMPNEIKGRRLSDMTDATRVADAEVGGTACYCVTGKYANAPKTVCLDKRTSLVRRIEFEATFPAFHTRETTTFEPVIDAPVAPALLEFAPPSQK